MLKTLLAQVKGYKAASALALLFTALEVLMEVLIPFVTASIIDKGIEAGDLGQVYFYGGIMVVMAFFSLAFGILRAALQPRRHPALPATCGTPSTPRCRPLPFLTSTSTVPPAWSPV